MPRPESNMGEESTQGIERAKPEEKVEIALTLGNLEAMDEELNLAAQDILAADHALLDAYKGLTKGDLERVKGRIEASHRILLGLMNGISDNAAKVRGLSPLDHAEDYWTSEAGFGVKTQKIVFRDSKC